MLSGIPLCVLSRAANVFPCSFLANLGESWPYVMHCLPHSKPCITCLCNALCDALHHTTHLGQIYVTMGAACFPVGGICHDCLSSWEHAAVLKAELTSPRGWGSGELCFWGRLRRWPCHLQKKGRKRGARAAHEGCLLCCCCRCCRSSTFPARAPALQAAATLSLPTCSACCGPWDCAAR